MSFFTSLIILLLAMVIQAFLQLTPGVFAIFYHHALGKTSAKKADDQALSFILGTEICIAVTFLFTYILISFLAAEQNFLNTAFMWIMAGIFLAEAVTIFFFYFRPEKKSRQTTRLFIPRRFAKSLIYHAEHASSRSDTIALGIITAALELFFTLPLYIISSVEIIKISMTSGFVFIIAYIVMATVPLFVIRTFFRTNHNLAELQRFRVKKKLLFRIILSVSFLILAVLTFITGVSN